MSGMVAHPRDIDDASAPSRPTRHVPDAEHVDLLWYATLSGHKLCVLEETGRVVSANPGASLTLNRHPALLLRNRCLFMTDALKARQFREVLACISKRAEPGYFRADEFYDDWPLVFALAPVLAQPGIDEPVHFITRLIENERPAPDTSAFASASQLTQRQATLLQEFAKGKSFADIAAQLELRHQTVREAFTSIYGTLGVRDQAELTRLIATLPC